MSGPSFAPLTAGDALKLRRVAAQVLERFSLEELAQYAQLLREGGEWGVNESFDREVGR